MDLRGYSSGTLTVAALRRHLGRLPLKYGLQRSDDLFRKEYLQSLRFNVNTIVDVGVRHGTRELYEAFPDCSFVLVDPQRDAEALLRHRPTRYAFVNKGLAAMPGRLLLKEQDGGKTGFLERTPLTSSPVLAEYEVDVTTLDQLLGSVPHTGPVGIKIDTEGYELEILKGLGAYWGATSFVICEASIRKRFFDSYQMSELIVYMLDHNFLFFNFLNPTSPQPRYYDVLFVPRSSHLFD
jgi:FkbM family methyltransferase